jgi:hypothetical protein
MPGTNVRAGGFSATTYTQDVNLLGGDDDDFFGRVGTVTNISSTGALVRGTLLGQVTASGKWGIALSASADGSQTPRGILAEDVDPTGADVEAIVYEKGTFNELALTLGTGITITETIRQGLRGLGIFLRQNLRAQ